MKTASESTNPAEVAAEPTAAPADPSERTDWRLRRWQVSFRSGEQWYPVGEYVALDEASAIERAIAVLGQGADYRAELIPWDAAPLHKMIPTSN